VARMEANDLRALGNVLQSYSDADTSLATVQAHLYALVTYRPAADALEQKFPVDALRHRETLRRHGLKADEALGKCAAATPDTAAAGIVATFDQHFDVQRGHREIPPVSSVTP
jgi:hypothetical protein